MKLVLTTHNITLTDAIENHIVSKVEKLEHFDKWVVDVRVTIEHDNTKVPERQFTCRMRLGVRGRDLFAEDHESDLYAAIDLVTKKIEQQIRTRHSRSKAKKHTEAAKGKQKRIEAGV
ncbi:MAG: ribosome-associated translation inhibitor RaiA [Verrucomicrobiota bacterium]